MSTHGPIEKAMSDQSAKNDSDMAVTPERDALMVHNPGASMPRRRCSCGRFTAPAVTRADPAEIESEITYAVASRIKAYSPNATVRNVRHCDLALIVSLTLNSVACLVGCKEVSA